MLTLTDRLTAEGYAVTSVGDGNAAVDEALREPYDIIVLDVMLPGRDGFEVCRALRQQGMRAPILMLTARGQLVDRVVGLKLGADDYLVKPFEMAELLARLEALLRRVPRAAAAASDQFRFGDVVIDTRRTEVTRDGAIVELSALEFKLLRYFVEHAGRDAVARRALERGVGLRCDAVHADRGCARRVAAAEARGESPPPAIHPHRPRPRLQVRGIARARRARHRAHGLGVGSCEVGS